MSKKVLVRRVLACVLFLALAMALFTFLADTLRPPHTDYGSTWKAYKAEPRNTMDVLYFGSSYAYCDWDPVEIYRDSGLTGYVMAGSEQTMSLTYWYLKEALETQQPQAVVIEATGLFFKQYQAFTQTNVTYMPFSSNKLGAIFTASEQELRWGLLADLWFYHSRWNEVRPHDVKAALTPVGRDFLKGYTITYGQSQAPMRSPNSWDIGDEQYRENMDWLLKSIALCENKGIKVLVVFNPTYAHAREDQYAQIEADLAAKAPNTTFLNLATQSEALGLDPAVHYHDGGHLNVAGARFYAFHMAQFLTEGLELTPMEQTPENTAHWQEAVSDRDAIDLNWTPNQ